MSYCSDCGAELPEDASFCHECGAETASETTESEPENHKPLMTDKENEDEKTWRSWVWGFSEDSWYRNIVVGCLYVGLFPFGIIMLYYSWKTRHSEYTLTQMYSSLPGIDPVNSQRRNVIVGSAYVVGGFASLSALGAQLDEPEEDSPNEAEGGDSPNEAEGGDSPNEADCEEVVSLGGISRDSERFEVEKGQYIEITVENNAGFRTRGVLNYGTEIAFGESVQGAGNAETWRVFDPDHPDEIIEERTGEWVARYEPADSEPSTSGSVTVNVCTPSEEQE